MSYKELTTQFIAEMCKEVAKDLELPLKWEGEAGWKLASDDPQGDTASAGIVEAILHHDNGFELGETFSSSFQLLVVTPSDCEDKLGAFATELMLTIEDFCKFPYTIRLPITAHKPGRPEVIEAMPVGVDYEQYVSEFTQCMLRLNLAVRFQNLTNWRTN